MNTSDDSPDLDFFEDPETATVESARRPRRRAAPSGRGPRRPAPPPPGALGFARLAGLVGLAIAVVVGLVFWVGACQGQSRSAEYKSYMGQIRPIAQESAKVGAEFAAELGAATLTVTGFEAKLEGWSREQQLAYDEAQRIQAPGPLQSAHQQVLAALQLRALGLADLADTLAQAKASSTSSSVVATVSSQLADQAQLLSASDIVWTNLFRVPATATLTRLGVTGVIVPPSQFVGNPELITARSFSVVYGRLGSASNGGHVSGIHGSALVSVQAVDGTTSTTLSTGAATTIHVTSTLEIHATVEDSGNFAEGQIPVTLTAVAGGKTVFSRTEKITTILPQHQQTVVFSNLQLPPAAYGATASLTVNVGKVPGETNLGNNKATYPVFFSLAGG